ncbi:MAG TPA: DUF4337 domain-containing protein [Rhodospirillaceae bacterium]|nr:DUF4337 domain-containing protein [Rhodospirillaceae bacterium]
MEIEEIAESIAEHEAKEEKEDNFRRRTAVLISLLAMVLAITALGGNKTTKDLIATNIRVSDTWSFYQAKGVRETSTKLALDQVETMLVTPDLPAPVKARLQDLTARYRDNITHYETETDGSGRKELKAKAEALEHQRDEVEHREHGFALAEAALQIAIVLASAAAATDTRFLVKGAAAIGVLGTLLSVNAFFLLVHLPS